MTIGIDTSRASRETKTGVEWYAYYLIEELKKITEGSEHQFFLYTDKPLSGRLAYLPKKWQEKVLKWPPKYLWTKIRFSWEMLKHKPDVLFIPSHTLPIFFPKKTVMTIHDLGYERYPEAYSFFARYHLRQSYKFAAKQATKIIVPSEFTKKELIDLYKVELKKINVVHLGYNEKVFKPIKDEAKIEKVLGKYKIKKPYLLFVGRLETKKGLKTLLEAYQLLTTNNLQQTTYNKQLNLVLVGGRGYGYKELKPLIFNLKPRVQELGHLKDEEERAILYAGAEAFVFPSLYEGFGLPVLEAMASGVPIVASGIEPLKEVGGEAVTFFTPEDSEDLAKKIKEILENSELRNQMIQKGLERVKNFSWQKCAEETLRVLKNL